MNLYPKILLPVLVLGGSLIVANAFLGNRPEPLTRPDRVHVRSVEATRLERRDYPVIIRSRGAVRPTLANTLVAEVTGSVTALAEAFVVGGAFDAGDTLVQFDRRDYEIAATRARASLAQALARLEEQRALAEQARLEWRQLGRRGEPSALTLREPQLAAARADRDAAAAELERAELDLERTRIVAPYAGRVLERTVDPGQFVNRGGVVGRIHAIDSVEVRLPLGEREQTYLVLPSSDPERLASVELEARSGGGTRHWSGRLVRVEGVDEATRQLHVVARVDAPWSDPEAPLRVGQYVEARIDGRVLESVIVIPRSTLREAREVIVVDDGGTLRRRAVVVAWSDDEVAVIGDGLAEDERLVLTPLGAVVDGTPVRAIVDGVEPATPEPDEARRAGVQARDAAGETADEGTVRGDG